MEDKKVQQAIFKLKEGEAVIWESALIEKHTQPKLDEAVKFADVILTSIKNRLRTNFRKGEERDRRITWENTAPPHWACEQELLESSVWPSDTIDELCKFIWAEVIVDFPVTSDERLRLSPTNCGNSTVGSYGTGGMASACSSTSTLVGTRDSTFDFDGSGTEGSLVTRS
jgi:hypothetical protein